MRVRPKDYLFSNHDLRRIIENQKNEMAREINGYDRNYILNVSVDDLSDHLESKYRINPIILYKDKIYVKNHGETHVDVRYDINRDIPDKSEPFYMMGTKTTLAIPYAGDAALFQCRPSTFLSIVPRAEILENDILVTYTEVDLDPEKIKADFTRRIEDIEKYVGFILNDINPFNHELRALAKGKVEARRVKIMKEMGAVAALGYPIKETSDVPSTYANPKIKRRIVIQRPVATTTPFVPDPTLDMENYEAILKIIADMVLVMERSPHAFKDMKEEELRFQFLVPLNGHFQGEATGETFNYEGKTDILIHSGGKNIFIAECLIWRGGKYLYEKIDQLLGYTSWRDTKTALLIFDKGVDFTKVLLEIPEVMKSHSNFKRQLEYKSESGFRFVFSHKDDRNRELTLTVLAFNIPTGC